MEEFKMSHDHLNISECTRDIRLNILKMAYKCNGAAHLGGGLSIVELVTTLYCRYLNYDFKNPTWSNRDRFILSKGHGVLGYFPVLAHVGIFDQSLLDTFKTNESDLIAHPVMNLELGIESSNGSLGHGLSLGVGIAKAAKLRGLDYRTFVLLGDGECNEGSIWESVMAGAQFKLNNLIAIVDWNGFQSDGSSNEILNNFQLRKRWESFGWDVLEINGHDVSQIFSAYELALKSNANPTVILARTIKGMGISFMENNNAWHHGRLTEDKYLKALEEIQAL